ncbi:hypothetical protein NDA01_07055 [Trichocoleus desertorum AS-A10]|uniref:hypothetical protein n=1 Tax=Trichocoleus desertorum TaxID=1481672 RepID=UPI0032991F78
MLPIVVNEELVHRFNFYLHTSVKQGMRHQDELYALAQEFSQTARLTAYQKACELVEQGVPVVVTASSVGYAVWVSLRSLTQVPEKTTRQPKPTLSSLPSRLELCSA